MNSVIPQWQHVSSDSIVPPCLMQQIRRMSLFGPPVSGTSCAEDLIGHATVMKVSFGWEATWEGTLNSFVETEHVLDGIHDGRVAVLIAI